MIAEREQSKCLVRSIENLEICKATAKYLLHHIPAFPPTPGLPKTMTLNEKNLEEVI